MLIINTIAMSSNINVYQGNSKTILCTVSGLDSLTGYIGTLTVKRSATDEGDLISKDGDVEGMDIIFNTTPENNTLPAGRYIYEISIVGNDNVYTVAQGEYRVLESVKY